MFVKKMPINIRERTEEAVQNPFLFPCRKKKRFLESKEKGASKRVEWSQIGIRRPVFTPPPSTSTVHRRLRRWNRDKLWFYPYFFRRLRRWVSGRGGADWHYLYCDAGGSISNYSSSLRRCSMALRSMREICTWLTPRTLAVLSWVKFL